jgi:hypothetical protein
MLPSEHASFRHDAVLVKACKSSLHRHPFEVLLCGSGIVFGWRIRIYTFGLFLQIDGAV